MEALTPFAAGYLAVMENRFDQRGQGVACGRGWIPRSKKCSRDKASQTSKEAKAKTVDRAKARAVLKREVKAAKGQKAYVKPKSTGAAQISRDEAIDLLYETTESKQKSRALRTSVLRQIEQDHPDLASAIRQTKSRDKYSPDTAEVGDVITPGGTARSKELLGLSPETAYMQIISVKNGRVRGIPMDEFGMPLSTKAQAIKSDISKSVHLPKGSAWIKVNFPQEEWKGQGPYSSKAQKQRVNQPRRTDAFWAGYAAVMAW